MKNKFRQRFLKSKYRWSRSWEKLRTRKGAYTVVIVILSIILSLPAPLLAASQSMRYVDYVFDDLIYQRTYSSVNPEIVIIQITSEDITAYGGIDRIPAVVTHLCNELNSDESHAPAVIAVDTSEIEGINLSGETAFSEIEGDNVVIGMNAPCNNTKFLEDSLLSDKLELSIYGDISYTNLVTDGDGRIRHYVYSAENTWGTSVNSFAKQIIETYKAGHAEARSEVTLSADNAMPICYMHDIDDYSNCTLREIMSGDIDSDFTSGKIVFIGLAEDSLPNGYISAYVKIGSTGSLAIQANVVDSILNGCCKQDVPIIIQVAFIWAIAAVMISFVLVMKQRALWTFFTIMLASIVGGSLLLWELGMVVHPVCWIVSVVVIAFAAIVRFSFNAQHKTERINKILSHYIDKNIIDDINSHPEISDTLHGSTKKIAVLFADIRNYTSMSELVGPDVAVEVLNKILTVAAECINASGGTIDKYIGDCIMAFWGAPNDCADPVYSACQTALEMAEKVKPLTDEIAEKYNVAVAFGIGINYGDAVVGNIGCESRMDYTAIGDTVNLASRLEADAPGGMVYVSESVHAALKGRGQCRMLSKTIRMKGKINPITMYSLYGLKEDEEQQASAEVVKKESDFYFNIKFFGTRGSYAVSGVRYNEFGGHTTCMVLKRGDYAIIVDCGTGLYWAEDYLKDCTHIDVLFSHMHYDHILGLLNFSALPKGADIKFYGTFSEWRNGKVFDDLFSEPYWPVNPGYNNLIDVRREKEYRLYDGTVATFFDAPHPNNANLITLDLPTRKRVCVMVDCESPEGLPFAKVNGTDLLVYDGMFSPEDYPTHKGYGHSTFRAGCSLASLARAKYLIITHHNPQYTDVKLLEMEKEAKKLYPDMSFARDGAEYVL